MSVLDSWGQPVCIGDWLMITTPKSDVWVIKATRSSVKGSIWGDGFLLADNGHTIQKALFTKNEQRFVIKVQVDEVLSSALVITSHLNFQPQLTFTVG